MTISNWGTERLVNTTTAGTQYYANSTLLANGNYVVVWEDNSSSITKIKGQIFNATGDNVGSEFDVSSSSSVSQFSPSIAALADGGFYVSYTRIFSSSDYDVVGSRFSASGVKSADLSIDSASSSFEYLSHVTAVGSGYAVTYFKNNSSVQDTIMKIYDSNNNQIGGNITVNTTTSNTQIPSSIATLNNGNIVVAFEDFSSGSDVTKLRLFSSTGTAITGEIVVSATSAGQASLTALDTGGFAVTWSGYSNYPDSSGTSIQAKIYDMGGTAVTNSFTVNSSTAGSQNSPTIAALDGGKFMVGWQGPNEIGANQTYAQVVGYNGNFGPQFYGHETIISSGSSSNNYLPDLTTLADGRVVATWADGSGTLGDSSFAIHQQILDPRDGFEQGTAGADVIYGSQTFANEMHGLAGNDTLIGGLASDQIYGGAGLDTLDGGLGGINRLYGGTGDDTYVVHSQYDFIYENVNEGLDIVRAFDTDYSLTLNAGGANIEALVIHSDNHIGAGSANADYLEAVANNVQLFGGAGNDTLVAHGLNDTLYGSVGDDSYVTTTRAVNIREAAGEGSDTVYADNTDFSLADAPQVENLVLRGNNHVGAGTNGNDLLISVGISNYLFGGGGNDTFSFALSHGSSQVLDFDARPGEHDIVAFSTSQFANFSAVQSHLSQVGADAVITATDSSGDTFILKNVVAANLQSGDFIFV